MNHLPKEIREIICYGLVEDLKATCCSLSRVHQPVAVRESGVRLNEEIHALLYLSLTNHSWHMVVRSFVKEATRVILRYAIQLPPWLRDNPEDMLIESDDDLIMMYADSICKLPEGFRSWAVSITVPRKKGPHGNGAQETLNEESPLDKTFSSANPLWTFFNKENPVPANKKLAWFQTPIAMEVLHPLLNNAFRSDWNIPWFLLPNTIHDIPKHWAKGIERYNVLRGLVEGEPLAAMCLLKAINVDAFDLEIQLSEAGGDVWPNVDGDWIAVVRHPPSQQKDRELERKRILEATPRPATRTLRTARTVTGDQPLSR